MKFFKVSHFKCGYMYSGLWAKTFGYWEESYSKIFGFFTFFKFSELSGQCRIRQLDRLPKDSSIPSGQGIDGRGLCQHHNYTRYDHFNALFHIAFFSVMYPDHTFFVAFETAEKQVHC